MLKLYKKEGLTMYKREIEERIKKINKSFRILVVTGPRQVGKTTLLDSLMPKDMQKVSLDDEVLRREAKENPKFFWILTLLLYLLMKYNMRQNYFLI